jgi:hypothetical protein
VSKGVLRPSPFGIASLQAPTGIVPPARVRGRLSLSGVIATVDSSTVPNWFARWLGGALRRSTPYAIWRQLRRGVLYRSWLERGRPVPSPHRYKQLTVLEYGRRFSVRVFVETGTYLGDMVRAVQDVFARIYSIELSPELARHVQRRFVRATNVSVRQGDSGSVLGEILAGVDEPALFWLDAHYSGGATAHGDTGTPVLKELAQIAAHALAPTHVVLIDDARLFTGGVYPTMHALAEWVARSLPGHALEVRDDIIRLTPGGLGRAR